MKTSVFVVILVLLGVAFAHDKPYAFQLVDNLIEDYNAQIDRLEKMSLNYKFNRQTNLQLANLDEETLLDHADYYDFIIVGGGTAGSVLASRLSEVPEWKVLLLEAGEKDTEATRVPRNWEQLKNTDYNWQYTTTPQNYSCWNNEDHSCIIPLSRMLGGSSSTSNMLYTRGHPRDYDLWADYGNKNWCFSDVLPTFKQIENADIAHFDKSFHRFGGFQKIENSKYATRLRETIFDAAHELGLDKIDYNGKHHIGVSLPQLTINCGKRSSAYNSYLEQCTERPNLVIQPLSTVLKIAVKPHLKEAVGVFYLYNGELRAAKAEKEVIVTAGAINTPKLLLLSGIGPKETCDKHNIENIVDLPVGQNLKMRPAFVGLNFYFNDTHDTHNVEASRNLEIQEYIRLGVGPMSSPGIEAVIYKKCGKDKTHPDDYPDIELQVIEEKNKAKMVVTLNHPYSSGYVTLKSNDPLNQPIVDPNLLGDKEGKDVNTLLKGIEDAIKFSHTESFKKHGLVIDSTPIEGCKELEFGSEDYWKCAIKYLTVATADATGTAKMGRNDDHHVVDHDLKVRGVHKLRVADASVIPVSITGNLVGPSMMIGEKAAELLIKEWE